MTEEQQILTDTVDRMFTEQCTPAIIEAVEESTFPSGLWNLIEETGLPGADYQAGLAILRQAGRHCVPVPLAESMMVNWMYRFAGVAEDHPVGPVTIASGDFRIDASGRLQGRSADVAFAGFCDRLVVLAKDGTGCFLCRVPMKDVHLTSGSNMAGEPRERLEVDTTLDPGQTTPIADTAEEVLLQLGAVTRSVMMAGAMESVLELSVGWALEREQFGRPIARFQAIQQQLAVMASEVAASVRASSSLSRYPAYRSDRVLDVAVAKSRIGEAAGIVTEIAHQVHGAMGYTREHALNFRTRRLWCWREEYGNEYYWNHLLGTSMTASPADHLWAGITDLG